MGFNDEGEVVLPDDDIHHSFDDEPEEAGSGADEVEVPGKRDSEKEATDDKEEYGRKVQKRIDKLTSDKYAIATELEAERKRRIELEDMLHQREVQRIEAELTSKRAQKIELMDSGEWGEAAKVDDDIVDLRLREKQYQDYQRQRESQQRQAQPSQAQGDDIPDAQQKWLAENDWFYNPSKAAQKQKANDTFLKMVDEGFDPGDDETYVELDKRLNRRREAPPPSPGPDRGRAVGDAGGVSFTATDAQRMRQWGLNPNDPNARKEYLRNKQTGANA